METKKKIENLELKSTISEIENSLNMGLEANSSWQKKVAKDEIYIFGRNYPSRRTGRKRLGRWRVLQQVI